MQSSFFPYPTSHAAPEQTQMHLPRSLDSHHLFIVLLITYFIAVAVIAHLMTISIGPVEISTPPLCMHTPFAGIGSSFMLGEPAHKNRFSTCALNSTIEILHPPAVNMNGLSLSNLYHLSAPKHALFRDIEIHSLDQAGQFQAFVGALRTIRPGQRALILESSAIIVPDPRWNVLHTQILKMRFDLIRLEPCGGEVTETTIERGLTLQRCVRNCFNPLTAASAIVTHAGARKMLRYADRDRQAYDVGWFQGLVQLAEPVAFALYCVSGLNIHDADEVKRQKKSAV